MVQRKTRNKDAVAVENGYVNGHTKGKESKKAKTAVLHAESGEPKTLKELNGLNGEMEGRKRTESASKSQPTLGERRATNESTSTSNESRSESQALLLAQGLMANDAVKIDAVLQRGDSILIQATLDELPVTQVIPLLRAVEVRLRTRKTIDIRPWIRWVQLCFSTHLSYLSSPSLSSSVGGLLQWMRARTGHMQQLLSLHGKLSVLAEEMQRRQGGGRRPSASAALLLFNNDETDSMSDNEMESSGDEEERDSGEDDWWDDGRLEGGAQEDTDDDAEEDDDDMDSDDEDEDENEEEGSSDEEEEEEEEDMEV